MAYQFEWDPDKAAANRLKHGISFYEARTVFGDWHAINVPDPDHSASEERYLLLGMSARQRILVVAYTERPPRTRLISARLASRDERGTYGKA